MRKMMIALLVISLILVGGISGCTKASSNLECSRDSDCVAASCCHPSQCVPVSNAPSCSRIMCTEECRPGTLDCGQGSCACVQGKCEALSNTPVECSVDEDCACGTDMRTNQCARGPKSNINESRQCPDFCTGIAGNIITRCVDGKCSGVGV